MAQAQQQPERYTGETLPAWSLPAAASEDIGVNVQWPERVTRDWALGDSTGAGIRVCILDSGVQPDISFIALGNPSSVLFTYV